MARLIVVRHPPVVASGLCYGQHDPPFTYDRSDADALVTALTNLVASELPRLWSSPAERCRAVASDLLSVAAPATDGNAQLTVSPLLWELSMGKWEGRRFETLEPLDEFQHWMAHWQTESPPGGETLGQLQERVQNWLKQLEPHRDHLAVAHAGVVRALRVILQGTSWPDAMRQKVPHLQPLVWEVAAETPSY